MDKVEDFTDLKGLSDEKLIKLRDVVWQEYCRQRDEADVTHRRWAEIIDAIQKKKENK